MTSQTISASEFKATCLELFDRLAARKLDRLVVTKRGKPVAVLTPPPVGESPVDPYGFMRGRAVIPEGLENMRPLEDEPWDADEAWPD